MILFNRSKSDVFQSLISLVSAGSCFGAVWSKTKLYSTCSGTCWHLRLWWRGTRPLPWCTLISWPGERSLLRLPSPPRLSWLAAWSGRQQEAERPIGCWKPAPPGGSPGRRGWAWCWGPRRGLRPGSAGCWWTAGQHGTTPSVYKRLQSTLTSRAEVTFMTRMACRTSAGAAADTWLITLSEETQTHIRG